MTVRMFVRALPVPVRLKHLCTGLLLAVRTLLRKRGRLLVVHSSISKFRSRQSMDMFNSTFGTPPPFGMTPLDKLAWQGLIFNTWHDFAKEESHQRTLRLAAADAAPPEALEASAPPLEPAPPGPQAPPGRSPGRPQPTTHTCTTIAPTTIDDLAASYSHSMRGPPPGANRPPLAPLPDADGNHVQTREAQ